MADLIRLLPESRKNQSAAIKPITLDCHGYEPRTHVGSECVVEGDRAAMAVDSIIGEESTVVADVHAQRFGEADAVRSAYDPTKVRLMLPDFERAMAVRNEAIGVAVLRANVGVHR